ncbi:MAG TPA: DUF5723 family protein [Gillisia sp.]|nr:DUF5723 family protein [Gillisia sp.]
MRSLLYLMVLISGITSGIAQNKQLLYNVNGLPQSLLSNPGSSVNFDGHVGIPLFSKFHISVGSSGVNLYDIFDDSSPDVNKRVTSTIRRLTRNDYFMLHQQLEILSFGWRLKNGQYLSAGVYQEMDMFAYFPKDPALLVNEGNNDYINVPFDFSDVSFAGEILTVYHLGINKKINRKLTLGARGKLYSGIFNVSSTKNTGLFTTRDDPSNPNFYRHYAENIDVRVNTSGYASLNNTGRTVQESTKDLLKRSFFGGNIGAGIDIGGTYSLRENFRITASVLDIGFMYQQHDVENYLYYGSYATDGIEPLFPDVAPNNNTIPYWDLFEDEVDRNLKDETVNENYITWRPVKFNAALEFGFEEMYEDCNYRRTYKRRNYNLVGLHLFGVKRPRTLNMAMTAYYDRKFNNNFRAKLAYTVDDFSFTNIGLLVSKKINKFNIFFAADNLLGYFNLAKSQSASIQFGMQFIFKKQ